MSRIFGCASKVAQGKTIIDGVITRLEESGLPPWCNDYQVARVADWYVCLPKGCGARLGSEARIVKPHRVRVDGQWFDVQEYQTLVQKILNIALVILKLGLCLLGFVCLWKSGSVALDNDLWEALTWLSCMWGLGWVVEAIPFSGKEGLWKIESD